MFRDPGSFSVPNTTFQPFCTDFLTRIGLEAEITGSISVNGVKSLFLKTYLLKRIQIASYMRHQINSGNH